MNDILTFFCVYEGKGRKIAILVFLIFLLYKKIENRHSDEKNLGFIDIVKAIDMALLSFYIYLVIGVTLLSRTEQYIDVVNLQLFSVIVREWSTRILIYENILLFIPYAIFLFVLAEPFRQLKVSLFIGIISSFIIETLQKITHWGRFEIDDILMNGIGMLIGFIICKLILYIMTTLFLVLNNTKALNKM